MNIFKFIKKFFINYLSWFVNIFNIEHKKKEDISIEPQLQLIQENKFLNDSDDDLETINNISEEMMEEIEKNIDLEEPIVTYKSMVDEPIVTYKSIVDELEIQENESSESSDSDYNIEVLDKVHDDMLTAQDFEVIEYLDDYLVKYTTEIVYVIYVNNDIKGYSSQEDLKKTMEKIYKYEYSKLLCLNKNLNSEIKNNVINIYSYTNWPLSYNSLEVQIKYEIISLLK